MTPESGGGSHAILESVPTGVPGFDLAVGGGVPSGSLVILLGEAGAGHREFAYTGALGLYHRLNGSIEPVPRELRLLRSLCYFSIARSKEDILDGVARLFPNSPETSRLHREMAFRDLSDIYFAGSNAPVSWVLQERPRTLASLKRAGHKMGLLQELLPALNQHGPNSMVILDSLTSLARYCAGEGGWRDLLFFVEALQRAAKGWRGLLLALLDADTLGFQRQEELLAAADGVLRFQWEEMPDRARQRTMHVQKFRGLLPRLAREHLPKFEVGVTPGAGLELTHVRLVAGRR